MIIEQIYDKPLAHGSYAVESKGEIFLVDPGRNPEPYLEFAEEHNGKIVAVFETHPHADFASSHLEFQKNFGAKIYINSKVGVGYDFVPMEHNDVVNIGGVTIRALFTPGHSPDHNSYLVTDDQHNRSALFSGDALFVGDVGRPDLREGAGNIQVSRQELAGMMYETINTIFAQLPDDVEVYPAHGAGSLCGKNLSDELTSTIGIQKKENWAFQIDDIDRFMESFLEGQSFIPNYFPHSVELNREGVPPMRSSVEAVPRMKNPADLDDHFVIVDTRDEKIFKEGHLPGSINIQAGEEDKFETWLGTVLQAGENFYLMVHNSEQLTEVLERVAKIGYEKYIKGALVYSGDWSDLGESPELDLVDFRKHPDQYTIVDIRNVPEVESERIFNSSLNIPLPELRKRVDEIPKGEPIVVHCAGGYRSAIGYSILEKALNRDVKVYDLSEAVEEFKPLATVKSSLREFPVAGRKQEAESSR